MNKPYLSAPLPPATSLTSSKQADRIFNAHHTVSKEMRWDKPGTGARTHDMTPLLPPNSSAMLKTVKILVTAF